MLYCRAGVLACLLVAALAGTARCETSSFLNFESGLVRPLALSPDGGLVFATNAPDDRLAIFRPTAAGLERVTDVPVGLEPVAVAVRPGASGILDVWVVNHVSDSVSIVRVDPADPARAAVRATLLVGDEPRDVVFAGPNGSRAFVTTARRGQNLPGGVAPDLTTPGTARALVWVFDADDPFADTPYDANEAPSPLGGEPLTIVELFGDSPRALAASPDGHRVYAAPFLSGNRTTVVTSSNVAANGGLPPPPADSPYYPADFPTTALVVREDPSTGQWADEIGRDWGPLLKLALPDDDVFSIDADANPPALVPAETATDVGTVLYAMAVRPGDGRVFVANTDARNEVRFEPLIDADRGVQGRFVDNRVTVVTPGGGADGVRPVPLNPHVDRSVPTGPPEESAASVALPTALAFSPDGRWLYVTAFGSARVAIVDAAALADGVVDRTLVDVGGGPSGVALDAARGRLYVLNRFDETISIVVQPDQPSSAHVAATVGVGFDPSPAAVTRGRHFLFDGGLSGHGDVACGSCHVYADVDALAWDLGDPYGTIRANPNLATAPPWHPMKGPKTTQSLRGMAGTGPLHWRGDRTAASTGGDMLDSAGAFKTFNPAFVSLLGGARQLDATELQQFTDWAMTIRYPPNPIARLDGVPTDAEAVGAAFFGPPGRCTACHALPLGTAGFSVTLGASEGMKIPHLRNLYTKVGMFGQQDFGFFIQPYLGDQMRGFGFFMDGANAVLELPLVLLGDAEAHAALPGLLAYLVAFPTGLAPVVGQQVSANAATVVDPNALARRDLLIASANVGACDLVVKRLADGVVRGALYDGGAFRTDRAADAPLTVDALWSAAAGIEAEQLWTCVPPGSGPRMALDRDEDGRLDGDELDAGSDPADPRQTVGIETQVLRLDERAVARFRFRSRDAAIAPPTTEAGDPTVGGATLDLYNPSTGRHAQLALPAESWRARPGGFSYRALGAPIRAVRLAPGRLVITGGGPGFPYALDDVAQGHVVMRLELGVVAGWCADAVPDAVSGIDVPRRFEARRAAAPTPCPPSPPS